MSSLLEQRQSMHLQLRSSVRQLHDLREQMIDVQRLAAMGMISSMAAHEFNNLLVPIISYSELAMKHPDDAELIGKTLEKIATQGRKAALIVEGMLGLARPSSGDRQSVRLVSIIDESLQCLARDLGKDGITVKIDVCDSLFVNVIRGQLQQVMVNLIINARQAMLDRGGRLTITAAEQGDSVELVVTDTGPGIAAENIDSVFDAFFTTKGDMSGSEQRGTGLGLMVCQTIIEDHGGTISVTNAPDAGASFQIVLPVS